MSSPLVSVVMTVYNGETFLREAVDSILTQSYTDFEFIIVNDGSTDSSAEILRSYRDSRVTFVDSHHAFIESVNKGLALAKGKYIARQDADDIALPERLARQVTFLEANPHVGLLGGAYIQVDPDGRYQRSKELESSDPKIKWLLLFSNQFRQTTVMYHRALVEAVGGYRETYGDDYDLWSRMAGRTKVANLAEPLAKFRVSANSFSSRYATTFSEASTMISARSITQLLGADVSPEHLGLLRMIHSSDNNLLRRDLLDQSGVTLSAAHALTERLAGKFVAAHQLEQREAFVEWVKTRMCRRLLALANFLTEGPVERGADRWNTLGKTTRLMAAAARARPAVLAQTGTWRLASKAVLGSSLTNALRGKRPAHSPGSS